MHEAVSRHGCHRRRTRAKDSRCAGQNRLLRFDSELYRRLEHLGLADLTNACKVLSREQRWEELPAHITDNILEQFAVIGTYDEIADKLIKRFGHLVTNIEFSVATKTDAERETLADMARKIQAADVDQARQAIMGQVS